MTDTLSPWAEAYYKLSRRLYRAWKFSQAMFHCQAFRAVFVTLVLISLAISGSVFLYWMLIDTGIPMVHTSVRLMDPSGHDKSTFRAGERMVIERSSCIRDTGMAFYTRSLVCEGSNYVYFFPSGAVQLSPGCRTSFNDVKLPEFIAPGRCRYVVTVTFVNNPITQTTQTLPVPTLEIVP